MTKFKATGYGMIDHPGPKPLRWEEETDLGPTTYFVSKCDMIVDGKVMGKFNMELWCRGISANIKGTPEFDGFSISFDFERRKENGRFTRYLFDTRFYENIEDAMVDAEYVLGIYIEGVNNEFARKCIENGTVF